MTATTLREWRVRWLDANHRVLPEPIFVAKVKPGEVTRSRIYLENLDKHVEDIALHCEPNWVWVTSAPTILDTGQRGTVILELRPPYDLDEDYTTIRIYGTGNKVKII